MRPARVWRLHKLWAKMFKNVSVSTSTVKMSDKSRDNGKSNGKSLSVFDLEDKKKVVVYSREQTNP